MTLAAAWKRTLRADPGAPALWEAAGDRAWSRRELDRAAEDWADRPDAPRAGAVGYFSATNEAGWWAAFLGILRRGAAAAPIDPGEPAGTRGELERRFSSAPKGIELFKLTSGSTGLPRAIAFTGAQMLADGRQICATMGIGSGDLNVGLVPFGHSYGLGNLVVPLIAQGSPILCGVSALPRPLAEAIDRHRATVFPAVPPVLRALVESDLPPGGLGSLRTVISAGAALPPDVARRFFERFGRRVHGFYGSTETGGISFDRTGEATLAGRGVGAPLRGVRVSIEARGRIQVESRAVTGTGRFRTADRGRWDHAGGLVLLGRVGRMLKVGGRRVDAAEIERVLRAVPGVREVFVASELGDTGAVGAALAPPPTLSARELRSFLSHRLATWKIPRRWAFLPEFPTTPRGKPDRRKLTALFR